MKSKKKKKPFLLNKAIQHVKTSDDINIDKAIPTNIRKAINEIVSDSKVQAISKKTTKLSVSHNFPAQGLIVLFSGPSGTGKTLAAEVLAKALKKPLFRVDLGLLVSKYIGETEKNLNALFDAHKTTDTILLFDEADALFGKRTEVKSSHDRYANLETSYLLDRIEEYQGIVLLTSNFTKNIDSAYIRRFSYVVDFGLPEKKENISSSDEN